MAPSPSPSRECPFPDDEIPITVEMDVVEQTQRAKQEPGSESQDLRRAETVRLTDVE